MYIAGNKGSGTKGAAVSAFISSFFFFCSGKQKGMVYEVSRMTFYMHPGGGVIAAMLSFQ